MSNSLTHSLDQNESEYHGFGFPAPEDVPTALENAVMLARRIRAFGADYKRSVHKTARKFVDVQEEILQIQYSRKRTHWWFVTINPKPTISVETLHNTIVTMLDRPEIVDCLWTYEIREAPDKGLHAHICFRTNRIMDNNFVNRKIKSLFIPDICLNSKHVDVRWPESAAEYAKAKSYAQKTVVSKGKKASNDATKSWRALENIRDSYGEDHLLVWSSLPEQDLIPLMIM